MFFKKIYLFYLNNKYLQINKVKIIKNNIKFLKKIKMKKKNVKISF